MSSEPEGTASRRYTWPWFVLGGVILAVILAVLWLSAEIERARRIRELNSPPPSTSTTNR